KGIAWYEKEIYVPADWKNKEVELFLERAHWETRVWVNDKPAGRQESLSAPHTYLISKFIQPGKKNKIRIRVNNDNIYNLEYAHAVSAETQTNWNGIIGTMELRAYDKVYLEDVQVYPDAAKKLAKLSITIRNAAKQSVQGTLAFSGKTINTAQQQKIPAKKVNFTGSDSLINVT